MFHKNLILKSYVVWSDWWLVQSPFEIVIGEWLKSRFLTSDRWVIGMTIFRDRANTCFFTYAQGIDDRRSFDWESWFLAIFGDCDLIGITIVDDRDLSDFFFQNVPLDLDLDHTK